MRYRYLLLLLLISFSNGATAEITNKGILDNVLLKYKTVASTWHDIILDRALWLFWVLFVISMICTFSEMLLKNGANISEFFAEFIRYSLFSGFFLWLLRNAHYIGASIIDSLVKLSVQATHGETEVQPSEIVDIGFDIFQKVLDQSSIWSPIDSAIGIMVGLVILIIIALVAINMLLLLITSWVLLYAGVFLLGFGGCKWTSDIAINYYKTVLGIAFQLFIMVLLVGVGKSFIEDYHRSMSDSLSFSELAIMLVTSSVLLYLTSKLPPIISGIIGGGGATSGIPVTVGAIVGAISTVAATVAGGVGMAGQALSGAAANIKGGAQAIMEAMSSDTPEIDSNSSSKTFDGSFSPGSSVMDEAMGEMDETMAFKEDAMTLHDVEKAAGFSRAFSRAKTGQNSTSGFSSAKTGQESANVSSAKTGQNSTSGFSTAEAGQDSTSSFSSADAGQDSTSGFSSSDAGQDSTSGFSSSDAGQESATVSSAKTGQNSTTSFSSAKTGQDSTSGFSSSDAGQDSTSGFSSSDAGQDSTSGFSSAEADQDSTTGFSSAEADQDSTTGFSSADASQDSTTGFSSAKTGQDSTSGDADQTIQKSESRTKKLYKGFKSLVGGVFSVMGDDFNSRVDNTLGGRIAKKIREKKEQNKDD